MGLMYVENMERPDLRSFAKLTQADLRYIGLYAATAASLSTEHPGGIPSIPAKETVLRFME